MNINGRYIPLRLPGCFLLDLKLHVSHADTLSPESIEL